MASTKKAVPYTPAPPPVGTADLSRATWDELYRIAVQFAELERRIAALELPGP